ncbi:hypothetical protein COO60DRAFT_1210636 [Scenedesmus sp. NREL 46B-D3]|nr:hypothetical protein COO60DRAFT_1210636 [Scenedesmus sp. NREL 46B-D3]
MKGHGTSMQALCIPASCVIYSGCTQQSLHACGRVHPPLPHGRLWGTSLRACNAESIAVSARSRACKRDGGRMWGTSAHACSAVLGGRAAARTRHARNMRSASTCNAYVPDQAPAQLRCRCTAETLLPAAACGKSAGKQRRRSRVVCRSAHQCDGVVELEVGAGTGAVHGLGIALVSKEGVKIGVHLRQRSQPAA